VKKVSYKIFRYITILLLLKIISVWRTQKQVGGGGWEGGGEVAQTMYTHVTKCKNNKIKITYIEQRFQKPKRQYYPH
jgi:hypothetical protein